MIFWVISSSLVLLILFIWMRRRWWKPYEKRIQQTDFDFQIAELLRLLEAGKITPDEFERLKATILARKPAAAIDPNKRGFEVLRPRPSIQPLEDRWAP